MMSNVVVFKVNQKKNNKNTEKESIEESRTKNKLLIETEYIRLSFIFVLYLFFSWFYNNLYKVWMHLYRLLHFYFVIVREK